jgi:hypothetical protein
MMAGKENVFLQPRLSRAAFLLVYLAAAVAVSGCIQVTIISAPAEIAAPQAETDGGHKEVASPPANQGPAGPAAVRPSDPIIIGPILRKITGKKDPAEVPEAPQAGQDPQVPSGLESPRPNFRCDVEWEWAAGRLVILWVSPTQSDGLKPGDWVSKLNGRPAEEVIRDIENSLPAHWEPGYRRSIALQEILLRVPAGSHLDLKVHHHMDTYAFALRPICMEL